MNLIFCFDAYCCWSYSFQTHLHNLMEEFRDELQVDVLSAGLILPKSPVPIAATADYFNTLVSEVSQKTNAYFSQDFLWHIQHPNESDWFPDSSKPAMALAFVKEWNYELALPFAADMQLALFAEGRDLTDDEAYRHLVEKYKIPEDSFFAALHDVQYKDKAQEDFDIVSQFNFSSLPVLIAALGMDKYFVLTYGYIDFAELKSRFLSLRATINN